MEADVIAISHYINYLVAEANINHHRTILDSSLLMIQIKTIFTFRNIECRMFDSRNTHSFSSGAALQLGQVEKNYVTFMVLEKVCFRSEDLLLLRISQHMECCIPNYKKAKPESCQILVKSNYKAIKLWNQNPSTLTRDAFVGYKKTLTYQLTKQKTI